MASVAKLVWPARFEMIDKVWHDWRAGEFGAKTLAQAAAGLQKGPVHQTFMGGCGDSGYDVMFFEVQVHCATWADRNLVEIRGS